MEGAGHREGTSARATATLQLRCRDADQAGVLWDAVRADDPGSVRGSVVDGVLTITAGPDRIASLRVTLDDVLACLQAASGTSLATDDPDEGEGEVG